ncbi:MAG: DUF2029 domain-containing protein [Oligoflexia bacterium]|nr:DUF2029 domain-containing protein [Oligoflexia bacterium]
MNWPKASTEDGLKLRLRYILLLAPAIVLGLWLLSVSRPIRGGSDLLAMWSAAAVFRTGGNPYSATEVGAYQHEFVPHLGATKILMYPPWTLPIFALFALLPFELILPIFLVGNAFLVGTLVLIFWPRDIVRPVVDKSLLICGLPFYAAVLGLELGQISLLVIGCLVLVEALIDRRHLFWAGLVAGLSLSKPQLAGLPLLYLTLRLPPSRLPRFLGGIGCMFIGLTGLSLLINRDLMSHFLSHHTPLDLFTPTMGTWLQYTLAPSGAGTGLRFLPFILGSVFIVVTARSKTASVRTLAEDYYQIVFPLTLISAPHVWVYDFVMLVPSILSIAKELTRRLLLLLFATALALTFGPSDMRYYVWYPISVFLVILSARRSHACD